MIYRTSCYAISDFLVRAPPGIDADNPVKFSVLMLKGAEIAPRTKVALAVPMRLQ